MSDNIWTANVKSYACDDCKHSEEREGCLVSGLYSQNASVTFLLEKPKKGSATRGQPLQDQDGALFSHLRKNAIQRIGYKVPYNALYLAGYPDKKPLKSVIDACTTYTDQQLDFYRKRYKLRHQECEKLHVLVPMGAKASRWVLPELGNLNKERGNIFHASVAGHTFVVIPTLSLGNVHVKPGVAGLVVRDMAKAMKLSQRTALPAKRDIEDITDNYFIPSNEEELYEVTERILEYYDPEKRDSPDDWPIAVDTETNSLDAWKPDSKVLMASIAWDDEKSTAICLRHPEMPYSEEAARECLKKLMASPKPKVFHNMKFDYQFLELCEDIPVNNLWWDTMLAEHFLDEDKKGHYKLGQLASDYCPEYAGYKKQIQESLIEKVKADLIRDLDQSEPDRSVSYLLHPFYPDIDYAPVCERDEAEALPEELRIEFFDREKAYIEAHIRDDQDTKTSMRNQIRYRCKKVGFEYPDVIKDRDYAAEIEQQGYEDVPFDVLQVYAATDTDVTRQACKMQIRRMHKADILSQGKEIMRRLYTRGSRHLGNMEYRGTKMDQDMLERMIEEAKKVEEDTLETMREVMADVEFNPNSNDEMGRAVTDSLGFDPEDIELTEQENVSVTSGWMETMSEKYEGTDKARFLNALRLYKAASKARGTFMKNLRELSKHDGRIHTSYLLNGTKTGRLSSRSPNLQNIPKYMGDICGYKGWNLKKPFVPTNDDGAFWQMDISQAEIRVLCAYSKDEALIQALRDGLDTHSFITSKVFDIPYEEIIQGKKTGDADILHKRTACKRVVFGTLYGAGKRKIAEQIYGSLSTDEFEREQQIGFATSVMNTLFNRFPRIKKYVKSTELQVSAKGYVNTFFGRRRRFDLKDVGGRYKYKAQREAVNFRIQSTSSDLVLSQLIEVGENLHKIGADMMLTVHDSMGGEIPMDRVSEMKDFFDYYVVERVKEEFKWLPVPFAYDLEVGPSYGEPIEYELATTPYDEFTEEMHMKFEELNDRQKSFYGKLQERL